MVDQAFEEVRTMSYLLHPPLLEDMGLESAFPAQYVEEHCGGRMEFPWFIEDIPRISWDYRTTTALALFRIVQECWQACGVHSARSLTNHQQASATAPSKKLPQQSATRVSALLPGASGENRRPGVALAIRRGIQGRIRQFTEPLAGFIRTKTEHR